MAKADITASRVREIFEYDPSTGLFARIVRNKRYTQLAIRQVGYSDGGKGYLLVEIDRSRVPLHQLAWLHFYGEWPNKAVDHINGIKTDNRIANLRLASRSINAQNQVKAQVNSKSGLLGVVSAKGRWMATIHYEGKLRYLGTFDTPEIAHEAYLQAKRRHHPGCTI